ncbi:hypothetical protein PAPYR_3729 [Paratrimastix pyriformis]|uniref:Uncharacterized protein n=1 Tax=Paratrimastix pyriformis TaxID=342808 RepID=A0ABQ8ULE0_9EUKA|nr:hypothetical protein PAPYR_3729 [Paratrimastix pyriformis]
MQEGEESALKVLPYLGLSSVLEFDESVTAFDACRDYISCGTSLGRLLIFDIEGNFVVQSSVHVGRVQFLKTFEWIVFSVGVDGKLNLYDWLQDVSVEYGDPIKVNSTGLPTAVAFSPDFSIKTGSVYFGTSSGTLCKRTKGLVYGYNTQVLLKSPGRAEASSPYGEAIMSIAVVFPSPTRCLCHNASASTPLHLVISTPSWVTILEDRGKTCGTLCRYTVPLPPPLTAPPPPLHPLPTSVAGPILKVLVHAFPISVFEHFIVAPACSPGRAALPMNALWSHPAGLPGLGPGGRCLGGDGFIWLAAVLCPTSLLLCSTSAPFVVHQQVVLGAPVVDFQFLAEDKILFIHECADPAAPADAEVVALASPRLGGPTSCSQQAAPTGAPPNPVGLCGLLYRHNIPLTLWTLLPVVMRHAPAGPTRGLRRGRIRRGHINAGLTPQLPPFIAPPSPSNSMALPASPASPALTLSPAPDPWDPGMPAEAVALALLDTVALPRMAESSFLELRSGSGLALANLPQEEMILSSPPIEPTDHKVGWGPSQVSPHHTPFSLPSRRNPHPAGRCHRQNPSTVPSPPGPAAHPVALRLPRAPRDGHPALRTSEKVLRLISERLFNRAVALCKPSKRPAVPARSPTGSPVSVEVEASTRVHHPRLHPPHDRHGMAHLITPNFTGIAIPATLRDRCAEAVKAVTAVKVWAEFILPGAPPEYWALFAERLEKANELSLLEKYLPFNNRRLVSPMVYYKILDLKLAAGDFKNFTEAIERWPIVYPYEQLTVRIRECLAPLLQRSRRLVQALRALEARGAPTVLATATATAARVPTVRQVTPRGEDEGPGRTPARGANEVGGRVDPAGTEDGDADGTFQVLPEHLIIQPRCVRASPHLLSHLASRKQQQQSTSPRNILSCLYPTHPIPGSASSPPPDPAVMPPPPPPPADDVPEGGAVAASAPDSAGLAGETSEFPPLLLTTGGAPPAHDEAAPLAEVAAPQTQPQPGPPAAPAAAGGVADAVADLKEQVRALQRQIYYLYRPLFRLYEYQTRLADALVVLIEMRSRHAIDYFEANRLWTFLSLSATASEDGDFGAMTPREGNSRGLAAECSGGPPSLRKSQSQLTVGSSAGRSPSGSPSIASHRHGRLPQQPLLIGTHGAKAGQPPSTARYSPLYTREARASMSAVVAIGSLAPGCPACAAAVGAGTAGAGTASSGAASSVSSDETATAEADDQHGDREQPADDGPAPPASPAASAPPPPAVAASSPPPADNAVGGSSPPPQEDLAATPPSNAPAPLADPAASPAAPCATPPSASPAPRRAPLAPAAPAPVAWPQLQRRRRSQSEVPPLFLAGSGLGPVAEEETVMPNEPLAQTPPHPAPRPVMTPLDLQPRRLQPPLPTTPPRTPPTGDAAAATSTPSPRIKRSHSTGGLSTASPNPPTAPPKSRPRHVHSPSKVSSSGSGELLAPTSRASLLSRVPTLTGALPAFHPWHAALTTTTTSPPHAPAECPAVASPPPPRVDSPVVALRPMSPLGLAAAAAAPPAGSGAPEEASLSEEMIRQKRAMLVALLGFDARRVIGTLVDQRMNVPMCDVVALLAPYPWYLLQALEAYQALSLRKCGPWHTDMVRLTARYLAKAQPLLALPHAARHAHHHQAPGASGDPLLAVLSEPGFVLSADLLAARQCNLQLLVGQSTSLDVLFALRACEQYNQPEAARTLRERFPTLAMSTSADQPPRQDPVPTVFRDFPLPSPRLMVVTNSAQAAVAPGESDGVTAMVDGLPPPPPPGIATTTEPEVDLEDEEEFLLRGPSPTHSAPTTPTSTQAPPLLDAALMPPTTEEEPRQPTSPQRAEDQTTLPISRVTTPDPPPQ